MPSNRLIHEQSPYLLQHARNPVDWHPWGEEAFARARGEDKPIFLSVGYSTCHWCHVMERESFENDAIAEILNQHYIAVKVDREERPDVDKIYMTFVQATTGAGGWPMSVWLTPDLKPFVGGSYFPPQDRWGRPGFESVLQTIAQAWQNDRDRILASSEAIVRRLQAATTTAPAATALSRERIEETCRQLMDTYDPRHGGFGAAPKFPRPAALDFLLRHAVRTETREALDATLFTLRKMAGGGMHDQLGGGFHRYSVDERWHLPHFEKMLYDQAQLANTYLDAYQITGDAFLGDVARDIFDYVRRDLTGDEGQFYSAEDADSERPDNPGTRSEGAFYVWRREEIIGLLGAEQAEPVGFHYGVSQEGNVRDDPHNEFPGQNVLAVAHSVEETAQRFGRAADQARRLLTTARKRLFEAREGRPRPSLDDKAITAWNGLMLGAFARASSILADKSYLAAAKAAARFVRERLYDAESGRLYRRHRRGETAIEGYADDYAFLVHGLLDLYQASFEVQWLIWAMDVQRCQDARFWDERDGGYFNTSGDDGTILWRMKDDYDGAEPAANSVALSNLLRLAAMTDDDSHRARADKLLAAFAGHLDGVPHAMPLMMAGFARQLEPPKRIVVAGKPGAPEVDALLEVVRRRFMPDYAILLADGGEGQRELARRIDFIASLNPVADGQATAYICEDNVCKPPLDTPEDLLKGILP